MNSNRSEILNKDIPVNEQGVCVHANQHKKFGVVLSGAAPFLFSKRLFTHPTQPTNQNRIQGMFTHPTHAGLIISSQKQNGIPKWMMQLGEALRGASNSLPLLVSPRCLGVTASHDLFIPSVAVRFSDKISQNLPLFYYIVLLYSSTIRIV